jgi:phosphoribosyl 1,2-cyclic phosphodiesterase
MKLWTLGSGSSGNALLVEVPGGRVLVDAGVGPRVLSQRLAAIAVAPESIHACVITHEHADHVTGAAAAAKKWGWSLHASEGTIAACTELHDAGARAFRAGGRFTLAGMEVETTPVPHDAADPVALTITSHATGARMGICYDAGHVTDGMRSLCRDVELLVLEANHDDAMLQRGPYPYVVRQRIAGDHGHLSNRAASGLLRETVTRTLRQVVLAHLSENCNTPGLAVACVAGALRSSRSKAKVVAAPRRMVAGPFEVGAERKAADPMQYALAI